VWNGKNDNDVALTCHYQELNSWSCWRLGRSQTHQTWDIRIATVTMPKHVKLSHLYFKLHTMKVYSKVEVWRASFNGGERSATCFSCFNHRERTFGIHWTVGWVGLRALLDVLVKRKHLAPAGNRTTVLRSSSRYPSPYTNWRIVAPDSVEGKWKPVSNNKNSPPSVNSERTYRLFTLLIITTVYMYNVLHTWKLKKKFMCIGWWKKKRH
jgi:hypothetical protein